MAEKTFTYAQACALLGDVRRKTQAADERLQQFRAEIETAGKESERAEQIGAQMNEVVHRWAEDILAVGALPKGLWTVDFDSGQGFFYCWTLNEDELTHYHTYEEGFRGRKPLVDGQPDRLPGSQKPPVLN
jgi:hypothetical protein